jgi:hypothetical protein
MKLRWHAGRAPRILEPVFVEFTMHRHAAHRAYRFRSCRRQRAAGSYGSSPYVSIWLGPTTKRRPASGMAPKLMNVETRQIFAGAQTQRHLAPRVANKTTACDDACARRVAEQSVWPKPQVGQVPMAKGKVRWHKHLASGHGTGDAHTGCPVSFNLVRMQLADLRRPDSVRRLRG